MKIFFSLLIITIISSSPLKAEEFSLHDTQTDTTYGPFTFTNNAPITVGNDTYTIQFSTDKKAEAIRVLKSIIMPKTEYRNASIVDVIEHISGALSPRNDSVGINMVLNLGATDENGKGSSYPVNLSLRNISIYDLLRHVTQNAGLKFNVDESGIVVITPTESTE